jgi:acyl carrier protein
MLMDEARIYEKLTQIFHDVLQEDDLVLAPELTADDVEGWDSMSHIRLVISVERAFAVKFSASEVGMLKNVGDLVGLIKSKS